MSNTGSPSDNSRRDFLKKVSSGIVTAYAVSPGIKVNAEKLKQDISDSIEGKTKLNISVNGKMISQSIDPNTTLAEFVRNHLELTGTKIVCNQGECGSCTILLDGQPIYSCHILALDANGKEVLTIEGLLNQDSLHPVQQSFVDEDGLQCGFCTPGQIMTAYSILINNPNASDEEIKQGMSGNLCRCGAYPKIFNSVKSILEKKIRG